MITVDSKIKDIIKYPEACKVIDEALGAAVTASPDLASAYNMSLRAMAAFPQAGISPEAFEVIEEGLEELEIEEEDE